MSSFTIDSSVGIQPAHQEVFHCIMWLSVCLFLCLGSDLTVCDQENGIHSNSVPEKIPVPYVKADNSSPAIETQQATCHIVTEEIVATAKATVTRSLKGICASEDLELKYQDLKNQINYKIDGLKDMLIKVYHYLEQFDGTRCNKIVTKNQESTSANYGPRDKEITDQNFTFHTEISTSKVFTYFWKIEEIKSKIKQGNQIVGIHSPCFNIAQGYRMYLKLFPAESRGTVYVQVGLTAGDADDKLVWPFRLRHRVTLLDQASDPDDIHSRIWDPSVLCKPSDWQRPVKSRESDLCVGFGFTQETLFSRSYVSNDSLIIKLDVFDGYSQTKQ